MMESKQRCRWLPTNSKLYTDYHDNEWCRPKHDDSILYEMLFLECFQAGLSWITILKKRENFRQAFDGFDYHQIAAYDGKKIDSLMLDPGIIRHRGKIEAAITNAKIFLTIQRESGSFSKYIWKFVCGVPVVNRDDHPRARTELSDIVSTDLKKRGMKFVGSVTIYSYLQAIGIVNDHDRNCFCHPELQKEQKKEIRR